MSRDIIVIGASAGGIEALKNLLSHVPGDLNAAVFIVLHMLPTARGLLPRILDGSASLPVIQARDGESFQPRQVYVAAPDFHMMLDQDKIRLWRGPKENNHRPSINVLFRSAAVALRERVAGVVLSGMLDDGTAGLWWIKEYGGVAIVQDPHTAAFPDMPSSAMHYVQPDFILEPAAIGNQLARLANSEKRR